VLLKVVQSDRRTWLDLSGLRTLQIEKTLPGPPA
jgi:hypothetical protein